jgi:predicted MFS family arabinose efflux permease
VRAADFVVCGITAAVFAWWEHRVDEPMVDLGWFRDRSLATGTVAVTTTFFAAIALFFTLTQYLQFVLGYSALQAGLAQLPVALAMIAVSNIADQLVVRYDAHRVIGTGLFTVAAAIAYIAAVATTETTYIVIVPGLVAAGSGLALSTAPSTGLIVASTPDRQAAVGAAINTPPARSAEPSVSPHSARYSPRSTGTGSPPPNSTRTCQTETCCCAAIEQPPSPSPSTTRTSTPEARLLRT